MKPEIGKLKSRTPKLITTTKLATKINTTKKLSPPDALPFHEKKISPSEKVGDFQP